MLTLLYADKPLARTILNQQETDFLKSRVFNENIGEIILCAAPERTDPRQEYYTRALLKHYEQYRQARTKAKSAPASATLVSNSAALTSYAFPTRTACALSAGDTHYIAAIDRFLARIAGKPIEQQVIAKGKEIGQGSYGSAYRIGAFVVKIPRNKDSVWINFAAMPNAHPIRVQHYLNKANNQPDFARAGVMSDKHGDPVDVLVTKYIAGSTLKDLSDEEKGNVLRTKALLLLDSRGLYMHDAEVVGNILIQNDGRIYFIDADQMVIAQRQRLARTPSFATDVLEDVLEKYYQIMTKLALKRGRRDDEYRTRLSALRAIRGRSVAHE